LRRSHGSSRSGWWCTDPPAAGYDQRESKTDYHSILLPADQERVRISLQAGGVEVLAGKEGLFELSLQGGKLAWRVTTTVSTLVQATGNTTLGGGTYAVRATFSVDTGEAKVFVDGRCVGVGSGPAGGALAASSEPIVVGAKLGPGGAPGQVFNGSMEELYLKNVSTAARLGYVFADVNRPFGTYLIDLTRDAGRKVRPYQDRAARGAQSLTFAFVSQAFADGVSALLNSADIVTAQWDGFEKLTLIAPRDFAHSAATYDSGAIRGPPAPDWFHEPFPISTGLGILQGIEETHARLSPHLSVECSFMAPGLGPWRPEMAPCDQPEPNSQSADPQPADWQIDASRLGAGTPTSRKTRAMAT
jgi:hypothetical protein